jgi:hypothetical protein
MEAIEVGDLVKDIYTKSMYIVTNTHWRRNSLVCTVYQVSTGRIRLIASHKLIKINKNT